MSLPNPTSEVVSVTRVAADELRTDGGTSRAFDLGLQVELIVEGRR